MRISTNIQRRSHQLFRVVAIAVQACQQAQQLALEARLFLFEPKSSKAIFSASSSALVDGPVAHHVQVEVSGPKQAHRQAAPFTGQWRCPYSPRVIDIGKTLLSQTNWVGLEALPPCRFAAGLGHCVRCMERNRGARMSSGIRTVTSIIWSATVHRMSIPTGVLTGDGPACMEHRRRPHGP